MKVTTKTVKTLQLQRKEVDKVLIDNLQDCIKDVVYEDLEVIAEQLAYYSSIFERASKGEYSRIASDGDTMFMLNTNEAEIVDDHFFKQRIGENNDVELNIEIVDEEVFVDKITENNIQY